MNKGGLDASFFFLVAYAYCFFLLSRTCESDVACEDCRG